MASISYLWRNIIPYLEGFGRCIVPSYGGPEQLKLEETPRPAPSASEVLVRVHAAGVNPVDWQIVAGVMKDVQPLTFPFTPGIEMAGVVEEVGPGDARWPSPGAWRLEPYPDRSP